MADEKGSGLLGGLLNALHPDARGIISAMIVFAVFTCLVYGMMTAPSFFKKLGERDPERCWDLAEVQGAPVKFNKCTGELKPIAKWMLAPEVKDGDSATPKVETTTH
jgi:hypothetical protein